jgi:hypothetical protein
MSESKCQNCGATGLDVMVRDAAGGARPTWCDACDPATQKGATSPPPPAEQEEPSEVRE